MTEMPELRACESMGGCLVVNPYFSTMQPAILTLDFIRIKLVVNLTTMRVEVLEQFSRPFLATNPTALGVF